MHGNLDDHDVFVLKAIDDRLTILGVRIGGEETYSRCEILVPSDEPGEPPLRHVCLVEREVGTEDLRFYTGATDLLRVTRRRRGGPRTDPWRTRVARTLRSIGDGTEYDVTTPDGGRIGAIRKEPPGARQYAVSDGSGAELVVVIQESESVAVKDLPGRLLLSRPLAMDRFAFWRGVRRLGWLEPDRSTRTDSTLDLTLDGEHGIDRRLALAVSCLDILRYRSSSSGGGGG